LGGTAPGTLVAVVTGGGTTYNVAVSGMTGTGTVTASIAAGRAHDAAGNANAASTSVDNSVFFDLTPPVATVVTPASPQSGNITIAYTLTDTLSDVSTVTVEYSLNGGATWLAASAAPLGDGTTNLATSPTGVAHTFVWASGADLSNSNYANVLVRVTPADAVVGLPSVSGPFSIQNFVETWMAVGTGDFDGDGTSDILWHHKVNGLVGTWIIDNGGFTRWAGFGRTNPNVWKVVGVGDFNGDGTSNILWQNQVDGTVGIWVIRNAAYQRWTGVGNAWIAQSDTRPWQIAGVGDFNGDGTDDILWQNHATGLIGAWQIRNAMYDGWRGFHVLGSNQWLIAGIGDFNGDGTDDILWHNRTSGVVGTWLIRNAAFSRWTGLGQTDYNKWHIVGVGDFNGDGTDDVLWRNQTSGEVGTWLIRNAAFSRWTSLGTPNLDVWMLCGVGDFDDDGTDDILWHGGTNGTVGAWMLRDAAFSRWTSFGAN